MPPFSDAEDLARRVGRIHAMRCFSLTLLMVLLGTGGCCGGDDPPGADAPSTPVEEPTGAAEGAVDSSPATKALPLSAEAGATVTNSTPDSETGRQAPEASGAAVAPVEASTSNAGTDGAVGGAETPYLAGILVPARGGGAGLQLGQLASDVADVLGRPATRTAPQKSRSAGTLSVVWEYTSSGLSVEFRTPAPGRAQKVSAMTVTRPSRLKTGRGVGIGSTLDEVRAAYGGFVDREALGAERFVAATPEAELSFLLEDGRVSMFFIGPVRQ